MRLVWREFRVCLPKFEDLLLHSYPSADGIIATPLACYVGEKTPFTSYQREEIQTYWDSLTQAGEAQAFQDRELAEETRQRIALKQVLQSLLEET